MDIPKWLARDKRKKFARVELESCGVPRSMWSTYNTDVIASGIRAFAEFIGQHRSETRQFEVSIVAKPEDPNPEGKQFDEEAWRRGMMHGDIVELTNPGEVKNIGNGGFEVTYTFQLIGHDDPDQVNLP